MTLYEFRLLNDDGKVVAVNHRKCASENEAIQAGVEMKASYWWVEIWLGSKAIMRFSCR